MGSETLIVGYNEERGGGCETIGPRARTTWS